MSHCNDCGGARRHEELRIEETKWQVPFDAMIGIVEGGDIYQMLKCRGCSSIFVVMERLSARNVHVMFYS